MSDTRWCDREVGSVSSKESDVRDVRTFDQCNTDQCVTALKGNVSPMQLLQLSIAIYFIILLQNKTWKKTLENKPE